MARLGRPPWPQGCDAPGRGPALPAHLPRPHISFTVSEAWTTPPWLACFPRTGLALRPRRTLRGSSREAPVHRRWLGGDDCALRCGRPALYRLVPAAPGGQDPTLPAEEGAGSHGTLLVTTRTVTDRALNDFYWAEVYGDPGVTEGDQEGISSGTSGTERKPIKSRRGSGRAQLCSAPAPRPSAAGPCLGLKRQVARCPASS